MLLHRIFSVSAIAVSLLLSSSVQADYNPFLIWDLCSPSRISVTLTGAAEGGIIYIKGYGAACKQPTTTTETVHEFEFSACGIKTAETYFTIIVQKNPLYQTGTDLQESLICIFDLSDLTVGPKTINVEGIDGPGINKTVKPSVQMRLYKDGLDVSGSTVKLSDQITMTIQLDEKYLQDFDIKARSCTANYLDITTDFCATDTELFPDFSHVTQGVITTTFGAFRTTDLGSGLVEMAFSCTVQVCRDNCLPSTCGTGNEGWGRKKRAMDSSPTDELSVGASLSIGTRLEVSEKEKEVDDEICINIVVFMIVLALVVALVLATMVMMIFMSSRIARKSTKLQENSSKSSTLETGPMKTSTVSVIINDSAPKSESTKMIDSNVLKTKLVSNSETQSSVSVQYSPQTLADTNRPFTMANENQTFGANLRNHIEDSVNKAMETTRSEEPRLETKTAQQIAELKFVKKKLEQYQEILKQYGISDLIAKNSNNINHIS